MVHVNPYILIPYMNIAEVGQYILTYVSEDRFLGSALIYTVYILIFLKFSTMVVAKNKKNLIITGKDAQRMMEDANRFNNVPSFTADTVKAGDTFEIMDTGSYVSRAGNTVDTFTVVNQNNKEFRLFGNMMQFLVAPSEGEESIAFGTNFAKCNKWTNEANKFGVHMRDDENNPELADVISMCETYKDKVFVGADLPDDQVDKKSIDLTRADRFEVVCVIVNQPRFSDETFPATRMANYRHYQSALKEKRDNDIEGMAPSTFVFSSEFEEYVEKHKEDEVNPANFDLIPGQKKENAAIWTMNVIVKTSKSE